MLIAHIAIALLSIVAASYALVGRSQKALTVSYVLVALTLSSGTYLAVALQASLLHVCLSGLMYTVVVLGIIAVAHTKISPPTEL